MCKFIGKSNERILGKLSRSEILRLYSSFMFIKTTKTSNFTCQSKSFISLLFTCQVLSCELQPFFWHDLANDIYLQTAKTVFSHWKKWGRTVKTPRVRTYIFEAWKQQKWQIIRQKFAKGLEKNLKEMLKGALWNKNDLYWWKWRQEASLDFSFVFSPNLWQNINVLQP